ncbi:MAG: DUF58 domain-containing protein [Anaerolineales bacterium]
MTSLARVFLPLALILLGGLLGNRALLLLGVLLILLAGLSALWGRYCLEAVSYVRKLGTTHLPFGEETDLWIEVENAKPLPLVWLDAEEEFPSELTVRGHPVTPGPGGSRHLLDQRFTLRAYERLRRRYVIRGEERGAYDLGPTVLYSGDLFGFHSRSKRVEDRAHLVVFPKVLPLQVPATRVARPLGDYRSARRILEDPLLLAGAREYRVGESLRHVHWKATARKGALQTKSYDASASAQLILMVNGQTLEPYFAGTVQERFEALLVTAASLAAAGLQSGHPVGLYTNAVMRASRDLTRLPASRHPSQLGRILEALAETTPFLSVPFERLLAAESPSLAYGATLLVVTALVNDSILGALLNLRRRGHPLGMVFLEEGKAPRVPEEIPFYTVAPNWRSREALEIA